MTPPPLRPGSHRQPRPAGEGRGLCRPRSGLSRLGGLALGLALSVGSAWAQDSLSEGAQAGTRAASDAFSGTRADANANTNTVAGTGTGTVTNADTGIDPDLLARLDDPQWERRQEATQALLAERGPTREQLIVALEAAAGRPEAQARLLEALRHHHLRQERLWLAPNVVAAPQRDDAGLLERAGRAALRAPTPGALGVTHRALPSGSVPGVDQPSIGILQTMPGFPAHEVLRAGDLILSLNGRPVAWTTPEPPPGRAPIRRAGFGGGPLERLQVEATQVATEFSDAIQRAGANSPITLRVLRDGQERELVVTLASATTLQQIHANGLSDSDRRWRQGLEAAFDSASR